MSNVTFFDKELQPKDITLTIAELKYIHDCIQMSIFELEETKPTIEDSKETIDNWKYLHEKGQSLVVKINNLILR